MSENLKNKIWIMPKGRVLSHIVLIGVVNLASIVVLILFWGNIESHHKVLLLLLPVIAFIYLLMFVQYIELGENQFYIKTLFEFKPNDYKNITSIEIKGNDENSYLKLKINKPLYLRKVLTFYGVESQNDIVRYVNSKMTVDEK
ncbi:MAG: hypothetical protein M9916_07365 [Crocinitomicaceae bacterium]|nr:hypothetical protein [Crocinitomicaceae bacterium]